MACVPRIIAFKNFVIFKFYVLDMAVAVLKIFRSDLKFGGTMGEGGGGGGGGRE